MIELPIALVIPDAVKATGISRSVIYEALKSGTLKARKSGRRTVIEVAELRRWLESMPEYRCVPRTS